MNVGKKTQLLILFIVGFTAFIQSHLSWAHSLLAVCRKASGAAVAQWLLIH